MLDKAYDAKKYEDTIYAKWEKSGAFLAKVDESKKPFTISLPPPNATGTLHLGHAVMLAIEDLMTRYKRMQGYSALWLPGTDHAAIATQSVVEQKLQAEGIKNPRVDLGREKLLEEIRVFVEQSKDTIRNQMRKMGASCDWSREKYTLDDDLNIAVNTFFERMYRDGLIYHGDRIVNWDPKMQTTVADDELEYIEEKTQFYYFQYGPVVIGTARPETKFADKIIVVHPDDERYKDLHDKEFEVEWINGPIMARVITDPCVDPELGTGAMTITPAHSDIDFELAEKHNLERPQIINFNGHLNEIAGEFAGMNIKEARPKIVEKLKEKGLLVRIDENYVHNKSVSYRGKGTIEPQIMKQWFIDVNKQVIDWKGKKMSLKEVMQDTVQSQMINIIPERFEKIYFHWIDNLKDWCISRQIWWGHQIPMWFKVSAADKKLWSEHPESSSFLLQSLGIQILDTQFGDKEPQQEGPWIRDPDTLDTWFSSALWTFSTLGWPQQTEDLRYFHPTSVMETGYDILFFWVARMILASTYCLRSDNLSEEQSVPFKNVYLHGLVRDREGKKMSKSRPETCIDPLEMIQQYGADALRLSLIIGSTPGNDSRLYEEKIAGFRNFVNKIWNAARFVLMNIEDPKVMQPEPQPVTLADKWICSKLQALIVDTNAKLDAFQFSDVGQDLYDFLWRDFCDHYLEISKESKNEAVILYVLQTLLKLLHPFIPFVTEALWEELGQKELLIGAEWPKVIEAYINPEAEKQQDLVHEVIKAIRHLRSENKVEPAKSIQLVIYAKEQTALLQESRALFQKFGRIENLKIEPNGEKPDQSAAAFVAGLEIYLPLAGLIDVEQEKKRLTKEIAEVSKYVTSLQSKLASENFTSRAPAEVVEGEKMKLKEAEEREKQLKNQLGEMDV